MRGSFSSSAQGKRSNSAPDLEGSSFPMLRKRRRGSRAFVFLFAEHHFDNVAVT